MKNLMSRTQYVLEKKKINILDKIDPKQLPEAKDGFRSPVGSYMPPRTITELEDILEELGEGGIFYSDIANSYWKKSEEGGLVRVK